MIMKPYRFNIFIAIGLILLVPCQAQEQQGVSKYDRRMHHYRTALQSLIPTHNKIQFCGGMGLMSIGFGWDYGKHRQWETDVLLGFVPKYDSPKAKATLTLKQNYIPWSIYLGKNISVEPLACGIYLNTVFSNDFWTRMPERYPKGFYWFSTRIRTNVFLGQRMTYNIPEHVRFLAKQVTAFYEISTCDFYFISAISNNYLRPRDYLRLSFGLKFQIF